MIQVETRIKIPFIWGKTVFKKKFWSNINLIVGPNGSGKTLLAENLAEQFTKSGRNVSFLTLERDNTNSYIEILKNDLEIRQKIERLLSNMFAKSIQFKHDDEGNLVPIVVNKTLNIEYNLQEGECHGLKGILTLLTSLYSTCADCLIIDEPELHLHPQFQQFFMNEIRKAVALDKNRIFFLLTHSPFFIDLQSPEDLIGVVVCHVNKCPTYIENLSNEDYNLFRRFLPRFNTYHKQFFFSDNQIFVEGYTDQQIFSKLLPLIQNNSGSAGTGIIDVGGKDELGVFCKVCFLLGTSGRIIGDLDGFFQSKLRDVASEDVRVQSWLSKQFDKQVPFYKTIFTKGEMQREITFSLLMQKLEQMLVSIGNNLLKLELSEITDDDVCVLLDKMQKLKERYEKPESIDIFKTVVFQGVTLLENSLEKYLTPKNQAFLSQVKNLSNLLFASLEAAHVYILPKGCIEHYYVQNKILYLPIATKDRLFHSELDHILACDKAKLKTEYKDLILILEKVVSLC